MDSECQGVEAYKLDPEERASETSFAKKKKETWRVALTSDVQ